MRLLAFKDLESPWHAGGGGGGLPSALPQPERGRSLWPSARSQGCVSAHPWVPAPPFNPSDSPSSSGRPLTPRAVTGLKDHGLAPQLRQQRAHGAECRVGRAGCPRTVVRKQALHGIFSAWVFGPHFRERGAVPLEKGAWSRALGGYFRGRGLWSSGEEAWVVSRGEGRVNGAGEPSHGT